MAIFNSYVSLPEGNYYQWIGLRNKYRKPTCLMGQSMVSGFDFPLNQSNDTITIIYWGLDINYLHLSYAVID
jgi:hypothetical protein